MARTHMKTKSRQALNDSLALDLVNYLWTRRGKGPICADTIASDLLMVPGRTQEETRRAARRAIKMGYPICSSRRGFWWGTHQDINRTIKSLRRRIMGIRGRIADLRGQNWA